MPTDRYTLAVSFLAGGPKAVQREIAELTHGRVVGELVDRAATDAAAARTAGRGDPLAAVRALAEMTGADRAGRRQARQAARDPYPPPASTSQVREVVLLRAAGASLHVIADKVGRPYSTVRDMITRYEQRTGTLVTPARAVGADGRLQPARRPTIGGG